MVEHPCESFSGLLLELNLKPNICMLASRPNVGNNEARIDRNLSLFYTSSRNDTPILGAC